MSVYGPKKTFFTFQQTVLIIFLNLLLYLRLINHENKMIFFYHKNSFCLSWPYWNRKKANIFLAFIANLCKHFKLQTFACTKQINERVERMLFDKFWQFISKHITYFSRFKHVRWMGDFTLHLNSDCNKIMINVIDIQY